MRSCFGIDDTAATAFVAAYVSDDGLCHRVDGLCHRDDGGGDDGGTVVFDAPRRDALRGAIGVLSVVL